MKIYLQLIALLIKSCMVLCQTQENEICIALTPMSITHPTRQTDWMNIQDSNYRNIPWIVYSDRDSNVIYKDKKGTIPHPDRSPANLNEPFYVVDYNSEYVQVVDVIEDIVENQDVVGFRITNEDSAAILPMKKQRKWKVRTRYLDRLGWIKKSNLLLWDKCLSDLKFYNPEKFVAVTKNATTNEEVRECILKNRLPKPYRSPYRDTVWRDTVSPFDINRLTVLYLYKTDGDRCLVSEFERLPRPPYSTYKPFIAWMKDSDVVKWNSNVCIDVSSNSKTQQTMRKYKIHPAFFATPDGAKEWKENALLKDTVEYKKTDGYVRTGLIRRSALLQNLDSGIINVACLSNYYNRTTGEYEDTPEFTNYVLDLLQKLVTRKSATKIVLAIDNHYIQKYRTEIDTVIQEISKSEIKSIAGQTVTVEYGFIIYFGDKRRAIKSRLFRGTSMAAIRKWIDSVGNSNVEAVEDSTYRTKHVYEALDSAISFYKGNDVYNTNDIILIGGINDTILDKIKYGQNSNLETQKSWMAYYHISLIAFQHEMIRGIPKYDNFYFNMKYIIEEEGKDMNYILKEKFPEASNVFRACISNPKDNIIYIRNCGIVGVDVYPPPHAQKFSKLEMNSLITLLTDVIDSQRILTQNIYYYLKDKIANGEVVSTDPDLNSAVYRWEAELQKLDTARKLSDSSITTINNSSRIQLVRSLYTSIKPDACKCNIYDRLLLTNEVDMNNLIVSIENLRSCNKDQQTMNSKVLDVLKSISRCYMGGKNIVSSETATDTLKNVFAEMLGYRIDNKILNFKINDFKTGKVPNRYCVDFSNSLIYGVGNPQSSYDQLNEIIDEQKNSVYAFVLKGRNGQIQRQYWIKEELLLPQINNKK